MDYPGKVITKNQVTPTQTSATGIWTLDDAAAATRNNNWPVAGVPNPISKSLRFNSADSAYLSRTLSSSGNMKVFTLSFWLKRTSLGVINNLFTVRNGIGSGTEYFQIKYNSNDTISVIGRDSGSVTRCNVSSTAVFRDPGAWAHIVISFNASSTTLNVYANNVVIANSTSIGNVDYGWNNSALAYHRIGDGALVGEANLNGYMTELYHVDGQALTPSSFGMTDPITGVWEPLKYSGAYGTNGFYLNFKDATSTTTLGYDYSGNANNWTTNNFSVTAGAGNDSLTDVPTPWVAFNTTGDVGGVVRGNYATWNPLDKDDGITSVTNGNLNVVTNGSNGSIKSTIAFPSGKWYWEVTSDTVNSGGTQAVGIIPQSQPPTNNMSDSGKLGYALDVSFSDRKFENGTATSYGTYTQANGAVYMLAFDQAAGKLWYGINGTWLASGDPAAGTNASSSSISTSTVYCAAVSDNTVSGTFTANFGQRPFAYTPPSGFLSLCTTNLPASTVLKGSDYMNAVLYTGNGSSQSITGVGFQPDFTWIKSRSGADNHNLFNAVVGLPNRLFSNLTNAENTTAGTLTSFNSDGFSVGSISDVNANAVTFVGWNWKANGAGVTNTAGSITSTVSASTISGVSIATYTGTGSNATVGHGLGVAPSMIIIKRTNSTNSWQVYHSNANASPASGGLFLNTTDAFTALSTTWNSTVPASTVFSIGTAAGTNASGGTYVAYSFAPISGFSAFGSYTGNASTDGPFIYTGFRPAFVLIKRSSAVESWCLMDSKREGYNVDNDPLFPNLSNAEGTQDLLDLLSNGFKLRSTDTGVNGSGTYIYMAFAENPFKNALAR
jgi:hypothetical protein